MDDATTSCDTTDGDPEGGDPGDCDPHDPASEPSSPGCGAHSLPRRAQQTHLEPQLRAPHGTGSGTSFEAFRGPDTADDVPVRGTSAERAAEFRAGTRRGTAR